MNRRSAAGLERNGFFAFIAALALLYCWFAFSPYPALGAFLERDYSRTLLDRNGVPLFIEPVEEGVRREYLSLDELPGATLRIFLASEDRRFALHPGVDPLAVFRSLLLNIRAGRIVTGASTLTMQLARIIEPHPSDLAGKLREALDALRLEARLPKRRIFELWLNGIPFAYGVEGIQSASRLFFGKPASALTPGEAALLALVPRLPEAYNPVQNRNRVLPAAAELLLRADIQFSLFSSSGERRPDGAALQPDRQTEASAAARSAVEAALAQAAFHPWPFEAPHFVLDLRSRRKEQRAAPESRPETSLDLELNRFAENLLRASLARFEASRIRNGAVFAVDNRSGEILVYVGSPSYGDTENGGQIDGVRIRRQPGSTLKPFLYGWAIDRGELPNTVLPDIPTDFGSDEAYVPRNFDNRAHGPVRLRVALASSLNVPAVALLDRLGVENFTDFLVSIGFGSLAGESQRSGAGLALGNGEVSLYELVRAFAVFPRGGKLLTLRTSVAGSDGAAETSENGSSRNEVLSPYAAGIVSDILSDPGSRYPAFRNAGGFSTPFPAMFKTGTSNQYQNIWAAGATPEVTVGVWLGNFDGSTVIGRTGSSVPLEIVKSILMELHRQGRAGITYAGSSPDRVTGGAPIPAEAVEVEICTLSGMRATAACPGRTTEYFPPDTLPVDCSWHILEGGTLRTAYPAEYTAWLGSKRSGTRGLPTVGAGTLRILSPADGSVFFLDPTASEASQGIMIRYAGDPSAATEVYVNDLLQGRASGGQWMFPLSRGEWTIELRSIAGTGRRSADSIRLTVR